MQRYLLTIDPEFNAVFLCDMSHIKDGWVQNEDLQLESTQIE